MKPKDNPVNEDPQELQDPQSLLRHKKTRFGFLVMVYGSVSDGDKISNEHFCIGRPPFHATYQSLKNWS